MHIFVFTHKILCTYIYIYIYIYMNIYSSETHFQGKNIIFTKRCALHEYVRDSCVSAGVCVRLCVSVFVCY